MKKVGLIALTVILASTVAWAVTNVVTSVNIVGFTKITCPAGKYVLVNTAFKSLDGKPLKSADVFGKQLSGGTTVFAYDASLPGYKSDSYVEDENFELNWSSSNITYNGAVGFWIYTPVTCTAYLMGEVPLEGAATNVIYNGYNLLGFPYTASVEWTNTALAKAAQGGDTLFVYDPVTGYKSASYVEDENFELNWSTNFTITPSMGFWYQTGKPLFTNTEVRPYNP